MKDIDAIECAKIEFTNLGAKSIIVEKVTESILSNMLEKCDNTKHMEERREYYDDEEDLAHNTWIDVEGEGYGWIWSDKPKEEWHTLLRNLLLEFIKRKESQIDEADEYVVIVETNNTTIYHFVERESSLRDTIYTFSDDEIDY